jgi:hypothetical protein
MVNIDNRKFELYKIAFKMLDKESALFWQRTYIFLLIHGAFISVIGVKFEGINPFLLIIFGSLGIIFSVFWIAVLEKGEEYVYRWIGVINELEKELKSNSIQDYIFEIHAKKGKELKTKSKLPKFLQKRTTLLIRYVIVAICIFWILIVCYGIYQLASK